MIVLTGGSGTAGKHVMKYLFDQNYQVPDLDAKPLDNPGVRTLITDITDLGQVCNALSSYTGPHEFEKHIRIQAGPKRSPRWRRGNGPDAPKWRKASRRFRWYDEGAAGRIEHAALS